MEKCEIREIVGEGCLEKETLSKLLENIQKQQLKSSTNLNLVNGRAISAAKVLSSKRQRVILCRVQKTINIRNAHANSNQLNLTVAKIVKIRFEVFILNVDPRNNNYSPDEIRKSQSLA